MSLKIEAAGLNPEIVAAITAGINCVMSDVDAEMAAVIAAAIHHARGGMAVRFKSTSKVWAATGRQKVMDGRQFA